MPNNSKYEKQIKKHQELKDLSNYVYQDESKNPYDWKTVQVNQNPNNGFYAEVMTKGDDVAVVIRGTDKWSATDIASDLTMKEKHLPSQVIDAKELYNQVQSEYPDKNVVLAGHSLGGSVAQAVGAETGAETVTFNAYGIGDTITDPQNTGNITNYGSANDPIFLSNVDNQIGKTYIIDGYDSNEGYVDKKLGLNDDWSLKNHYLDNMGDISKAIEYDKNAISGPTVFKAGVEYNESRPFTPKEIGEMTPEEFAKNEAEIMRQLANGEIQNTKPDYNNYQNNRAGNGKLYTREEIDKMSPREYAKAEADIMKQLNSVGIPSEKELNRNSEKNPSRNENTPSKKEPAKEPWSTNQKPKIVKTDRANDNKVTGYVWVASDGSCEACQELDGQTFETEDDIPPLPHPNCNCTIERIIENKNQNNDDDDEDEDDENNDDTDNGDNLNQKTTIFSRFFDGDYNGNRGDFIPNYNDEPQDGDLMPNYDYEKNGGDFLPNYDYEKNDGDLLPKNNYDFRGGDLIENNNYPNSRGDLMTDTDYTMLTESFLPKNIYSGQTEKTLPTNYMSDIQQNLRNKQRQQAVLYEILKKKLSK